MTLCACGNDVTDMGRPGVSACHIAGCGARACSADCANLHFYSVHETNSARARTWLQAHGIAAAPVVNGFDADLYHDALKQKGGKDEGNGTSSGRPRTAHRTAR